MRFGPRWRQKSLVSPVEGSGSASMRSAQSSAVMSQKRHLDAPAVVGGGSGAATRWIRATKLKPRWDVHLSGDDDQLG